MARNICKNEDELIGIALESLRESNPESEYCVEYASFDDVPKRSRKKVFRQYLQDIVYNNGIAKNVDVDCENVGEGGEYTDGGLKGFLRLDTGEVFYAFDCGGDWEVPVNAILYAEDGKIKMYVPERGNNFCTEHMCAWGSEPDGI